MLEWLTHIVSKSHSLFVLLPSFFLLGLISAIGNFCNLGALGAVVGYAGISENHHRKDSLTAALGFFLGTVCTLTLIGIIIGYMGEIAGMHMGKYGKLVTGFLAIIFGLMALNLLPVKMPEFKKFVPKKSLGILGAFLFGGALGTISVACGMACCMPALPIAIGAAALQGATLKGTLIMGIFAAGYSVPLAAVLYGVSFGKWTLRASRFSRVVTAIAGTFLLVIGFYFLATL